MIPDTMSYDEVSVDLSCMFCWLVRVLLMLLIIWLPI